MKYFRMPSEIIKSFWMPPTLIVAVIAIIAIIITLCWIYKALRKYFICHTSSCTNSPVVVEFGNAQGLVEYSLEELRQATNDFSQNNLIGQGRFGPVYIGLIRNTTVAIKRLSDSSRFLAEVVKDLYITQHCNVVNLYGYCCKNGYQMLIYEYLVNGNMRNYLHRSIELKFNERIIIALGAAKGLQHLHSLSPPLAHNRFSTSKVLLDADFNAKVSDAGLLQLIDVHDLELGFEHRVRFNKTGDVYGFGLFLLELITGEEPKGLTTNDHVFQWIDSRVIAHTLLDKTVNETLTDDAFEGVLKLIVLCLRFPARIRPNMEMVVTELEKILIVNSEEYSINLTLGSELFNMTA